jgi:hypothetical protein
MSNRCIAPSEILTPQASSAFGSVAEITIASDYLSFVGRTAIFPASTKDFVDYTPGFGNVPMMIAFLKTNNPKLSVSKVASLSGAGLTKVADIITHDSPIQTAFYEIKPNSVDGRFAGRIKVASVDALMTALSLPYVPGTIYMPDKSIRFFSGMVLGSPLELFFHFKRTAPGLILYEICAEGDLEKIGLKVLISVIAATIVILLLPETAPVLVPALA